MHLHKPTLAVLGTAVLFALACGTGDTPPADPAVGASCEHLGSTDGAFACENDKVIFCSALTENKWEVAQDMFQCDDGKTCKELDGNKTTCE